MSEYYPGSEFEFDFEGRPYRAVCHFDDSHGAPWEECDGFFPVRRVRHDYGAAHGESKRPSEVILYRGGRNQWTYVYDRREAIAQALREEWDPSVPGETKRQQAARAVDKTASYLRGWCADEWCYLILEVFRIDTEGRKVGDSEFLGGVESSDGEHCEECAADMAHELRARARAERIKRKQVFARKCSKLFPGPWPMSLSASYRRFNKGARHA